MKEFEKFCEGVRIFVTFLICYVGQSHWQQNLEVYLILR
jgi:hypothetical protein